MAKPRPRKPFRYWLQQIHLWAGLILCLPLVLLGITGSLLVYGHDIDRLLGGGDPPASIAGERHSPGEVLAAATAQGEPGRLPVALRWPSEPGEAAAVRLSRPAPGRAGAGNPFAGSQQLLVDPVTLQILDGGGMPGWLRFVHDLHGNLMLGRDGRAVVGWLGIAMLVLGVSGLVLWWPRPGQWKGGQWRAAFGIRRGAKGLRLYRDLHGMLGIWSLVIFMIVSFSGVYLGFPQQTAATINAVFPGRDLRAALQQARVQPLAGAPAIGLDAAVALARQQVGDGRLLNAVLPARPDQALRIGLARPGHAEGAPAVTVLVDPWRHSVIAVFDPQEYSIGESIVGWQRGLHEGAGLGPVYRLLVFAVGIVIPVFAVTGFFMWWIKRRNRRNTERAKQAAWHAAGATGTESPATAE